MNYHNKKGFTLIEIIVVLTILTILSAIAVPAVTGYIKETEKVKFVTASNTIFDEIQVDVEKYFASNSESEAIQLLREKYSKYGNYEKQLSVGEGYVDNYEVYEISICFDDTYDQAFKINSSKDKHTISKVVFTFKEKSSYTYKYVVIIPNDSTYWYRDSTEAMNSYGTKEGYFYDIGS